MASGPPPPSPLYPRDSDTTHETHPEPDAREDAAWHRYRTEHASAAAQASQSARDRLKQQPPLVAAVVDCSQLAGHAPLELASASILALVLDDVRRLRD